MALTQHEVCRSKLRSRYRAFVRSFEERGRLGLSRVQHGIAAMLLPDLGEVAEEALAECCPGTNW